MAVEIMKNTVPLCVGKGNGKLGDVLTFSLPSTATCPGASPWCLNHCYAWRLERIRPNCRRAYKRNEALTLDSDEFVERILEMIPEFAACFRIHVGGDFHSSQYIDSWNRICSARPHVRFWAYTRSWILPSLRWPLESLRRLENVQIFGSTDPTMGRPPATWRVAFIDCDLQANGMPCKEQHNQAQSCLDCGYCFHQTRGNVVFEVH